LVVNEKKQELLAHVLRRLEEDRLNPTSQVGVVFTVVPSGHMFLMGFYHESGVGTM
jgi:hypothetical protein